ncbi:MAG: Glu-tRNA(Gln) amidotransferase subunit GatE [Nanoarchaeota archaeon]|nr:Glu-tRNA(Gln) amidotransferase subunit GatE [Nanoarchaeota archaeon]
MNYKELGFRSGLEIHQQIEGHKLFCGCPCLVNDEHVADIHFLRKLRATAGETGKMDAAAAYETQKNRQFVYEACSSSSCLVEYDEEPPHVVNQDALEAALQVALLVKAKVVRHIQFMRKTVVDGSNVSGFQRTALVAYDGILETLKGPVKIDTICLEEESAKKIKDEGHEVHYRLDRLGVPLIEIATDASLKDPEHVKEVAGMLGMILRSTGKVRRGLGTIRQDVNVSIASHPRVELKGFQDLRSMVPTVDAEIKRQQVNVNNKSGSSEVRKVNPDFSSSFLRPMPGAGRMYPETDHPIIHLTDTDLKKIKIPELLTEKVLKLEKQFGLSPDLAREVLDHPWFESLVLKYPQVPALFIAHMLVENPKELKARFGLDPEKLQEHHVAFALDALDKGKIPKSAVFEILKLSLEGKQIDLKQFEAVSADKLEKEILAILDANKGAPFNALMGEVMKKLKGKVDGKQAAELIKKFM